MAVECRRCLVKQKNSRAFQHGTGDGDPLFLAAGQFQSAFTHDRFQPVRQAADKARYLGHFRRIGDISSCRARAAEADIVADRFIEQNGVLRHDADSAADGMLGQAADIVPVYLNDAFCRVVESEQQAANGGFAAAARSDKGELVSGLDLEADVFQDRPARVIGE